MAVTITGEPNQFVSNVAVTRSGNKYTVSWKIPSNLTSESNARRATWFEICFRVYSVTDKQWYSIEESKVLSKTTTSWSWNWDGTKNYKNISKIAYMINSCNNYYEKNLRRTVPGQNYMGYKYLDVNVPYAPTLSTPVWDSEAGTVKCTLTGKSASRDYPRYQYHFKAERVSRINGIWDTDSYITKYDKDTSIGWDTNDTKTWTYTATDEENLVTENDFIKYRFWGYAKGIRGYSSSASSYIYIAYPAQPTISTIAKAQKANGIDVTIDYNEYEKTAGMRMHPVETAQLYIAYAEKKGQIQASDWTAVGDEIKNPARGFFVSDSDITPEVGQHVFLKCITKYQQYETSSDIVDVDAKIGKTWYYKKPTGQDDAPAKQVSIVHTEAGDDNTSVVAVIGYPNSDIYNACEISYSSDTYAWGSTKQPDTYQMEDGYWHDATKSSYASAYDNSATIKISDLDEGTKYFLRARRYNTVTEAQRTNWSTRAEQSTNQDELTGLVLTGSDIIATGKTASFSWEFPEDLKQTQWILYRVTTDANKKNVYTELENGTGSITMVSHTFNEAGTYRICVRSYFEDKRDMTSSEIQLQVVDAPLVKFTTPPTSPLTTLPQTFTVQAVDKDGNKQESADLQIKVLAHGILSQKPDGNEQQYTNDVVASFEGSGEKTCEISNGSVLWNNGSYQIQAVASANGVKSDVYTCDFDVAYSASVTAPSDENVVITPTATKGATIQVNNLEDGQTWDLYRATKDERNFLIKSGQISGATVEDKFAPYCSKTNSQYIVLVKNANAQTDYRYYDYVADYDVLRFDWDNKFVELPYNIEIEDETDKQFEQQIYLDGTQKGAWGASVIRQASLSTDTIYITDEDTQRKVRDLARYQGAVFVRTPLGQAYTANVEVNKISKSYDSKVMAVSFDCTEIDMVSAFEASSSEGA